MYRLLIDFFALQSEYFQDDIFPKTRITWKAATTSEKWFNGCSLTPEVLDLRPAEMENLSNAPPPPITPKRTYAPPLQDSVPIQFEGKVNMESSLSVINSGRRQQEKLVQSMSGRVNCLVTKDLPQKSFEGVGDEEWVSEDCVLSIASNIQKPPLNRTMMTDFDGLLILRNPILSTSSHFTAQSTISYLFR